MYFICNRIQGTMKSYNDVLYSEIYNSYFSVINIYFYILHSLEVQILSRWEDSTWWIFFPSLDRPYSWIFMFYSYWRRRTNNTWCHIKSSGKKFLIRLLWKVNLHCFTDLCCMKTLGFCPYQLEILKLMRQSQKSLPH